MASRLPTISLKAVHIPKRALPCTIALLLLLIAFLVSNFWLTIGVVGALYILTIPVSCFMFAKARDRYMQSCVGTLDAKSAKV